MLRVVDDTETARRRRRLVKFYRDELAAAKQWKLDGRTHVSGPTGDEPATASWGLAKGRAKVPIDEYIHSWMNGLIALHNGADPDLYEY